jgi:hypothetical protein
VTLTFTPGDRVRLTAAIDGNATDVTWRWVPPAGSSAPASTTNVLEWTTGANDAGVYDVEVTSPTASDSPGYGVIRLQLPPTPSHPYITAVETADGQPLEPSVKAAMLELIADLEATSGYAAMGLFIPGIGGRTIAGGMVPLIGPAPTLQNMTQGDYNRTLGISGDGISKWLHTLSAGSGNNFHVSMYATRPLMQPGVYVAFAGIDDVNDQVLIHTPQFGGGDLIRFAPNANNMSITTPDGYLPGFIGVALNGTTGEAWTNAAATETAVNIRGGDAGPEVGFLARIDDALNGSSFANNTLFGLSTGFHYNQPMAVRAALIKYQAALVAALPGK